MRILVEVADGEYAKAVADAIQAVLDLVADDTAMVTGDNAILQAMGTRGPEPEWVVLPSNAANAFATWMTEWADFIRDNASAEDITVPPVMFDEFRKDESDLEEGR